MHRAGVRKAFISRWTPLPLARSSYVQGLQRTFTTWLPPDAPLISGDEDTPLIKGFTLSRAPCEG